MKSIYKIAILISIATFFIAGCSSNSAKSEDSSYYSAESEVNQNYNTDRIVEKSYSVNITSDNVGEASKNLKTLVNKVGGYALYSNESITSEYYSYTLKIPAEKIDEFNTSLEDIGEITRIDLYSDDITDTYNNNEAKLTALKTQEQRLLNMMANAETISDLIIIEEKLVQIQSDIEYYTNEINRMDSAVEYTTYTVSLSAKFKEKPAKNFSSNVEYAFTNSINLFISFFEGLFIILIYLLPFIILGIIIYLLFKNNIKNIFKKDKQKWTK